VASRQIVREPRRQRDTRLSEAQSRRGPLYVPLPLLVFVPEGAAAAAPAAVLRFGITLRRPLHIPLWNRAPIGCPDRSDSAISDERGPECSNALGPRLEHLISPSLKRDGWSVPRRSGAGLLNRLITRRSSPDEPAGLKYHPSAMGIPTFPRGWRLRLVPGPTVSRLAAAINPAHPPLRITIAT